MSAANGRMPVQEERGTAAGVAVGILGVAWHAVRVPILLFLLALEPFVRILLIAAAILGVLSAIVFEASGAVPEFSLWFQILMSFGCMLVLALYYALIRVLS
ncbi:MAG: hypothetical protein ACREV5_03215 [Steroidobacter sp.]